ncbi:unnamed protein product [Citrullus colocynthis]|uniref:C3H1-type domain-containing protein n=1 Tax=Citrullus colocynthis TaxID=252529 RepID=A0ABP0YQ15_9ROSI
MCTLPSSPFVILAVFLLSSLVLQHRYKKVFSPNIYKAARSFSPFLKRAAEALPRPTAQAGNRRVFPAISNGSDDDIVAPQRKGCTTRRHKNSKNHATPKLVEPTLNPQTDEQLIGQSSRRSKAPTQDSAMTLLQETLQTLIQTMVSSVVTQINQDRGSMSEEARYFGDFKTYDPRSFHGIVVYRDYLPLHEVSRGTKVAMCSFYVEGRRCSLMGVCRKVH